VANMESQKLRQKRKIISASSTDHSARSHQSELSEDARTILPLPAEVIAQIKSSATINSLTSVILGLVQNSLDADASKITVEVDFGKGDCLVEDDGLGIAPGEFGVEGGLGRLYRKSCS
jgi:DNA mismatch repair protein MLH3